MNGDLRSALEDVVGARLTVGGAGMPPLVAAPSSERELAAVLRVLRAHGARVGVEVAIDRVAFSQLGPVDAQSALVVAGAGAPLAAVERVARGAQLSLGPLSPAALELPVAALLEGPYAGLRAIPGGRLEPIAIALHALMPDGMAFDSRAAPRSAAGPDLDALFFGAGGRTGLLLGATLRLVPLAASSGTGVHSFSTAQALVRALLRALSDGCWIDRARVERRDGRFLLEARVVGGADGVARDLASIAHRAIAGGGRSAGQQILAPWTGAGQAEREVSWDAVVAALDAGRGAWLYRLATESVIADGAVEGHPLNGEGRAPAHPAWEQVLAAVDPDRWMGGPP